MTFEAHYKMKENRMRPVRVLLHLRHIRIKQKMWMRLGALELRLRRIMK